MLGYEIQRMIVHYNAKVDRLESKILVSSLR
jgi:hypothetical protein